MVEYRTNQAGGSDESGDGSIDGGIVDNAIESAIERVRSDPKAKLQIAQALRDNYGIPPEIVGAFVGDVPDDTAEASAPDKETPQEPQAGPQIGATMETQSVTADDVIGFLDEVAEYQGEDTTLGELREFAEQNPDVIETAISLKL